MEDIPGGERVVDSYIVRIYRRRRHDAGELDGLVEIVGGGSRIAFHCSKELWDILAQGGPAGVDQG